MRILIWIFHTGEARRVCGLRLFWGDKQSTQKYLTYILHSEIWEGFTKPLCGESSPFNSPNFNCRGFCLLEKGELMRQCWWHLVMIIWAGDFVYKAHPYSISAGCPRRHHSCSPAGKALPSQQLFCSNCTLTTLLQGIYTGKHSGCAGWQSLKSTALAYWSRNSYFLSHNYVCFASGLHNSYSKSFGISQGSLFPKLSNHWGFLLTLFPDFAEGQSPVSCIWMALLQHLVCLMRGPGLQQLLVSRDQSMLWAAAAISWSFNALKSLGIISSKWKNLVSDVSAYMCKYVYVCIYTHIFIGEKRSDEQ